VAPTPAGCSGTDLIVSGELLAAAPTDGELLLSRTADVADLRAPVTFGETTGGRTPFRAVLPLADFLAGAGEPWTPPPGGLADRWRLRLAFRDGGDQRKAVPVLAADPATARTAMAGRDVLVRRDPSRALVLVARAAGPVATAATWRPDGTLELTGEYRLEHGAPAVLLQLRGQNEQVPLAVTTADGAFTARIDPSRVPSWGGHVELRPGDWDVLSRSGGVTADLLVTDELRARCPVPSPDPHRDFALDPTEGDGLALRADPVLRPSDRGAHARRLLRHRLTPALKRSPLREAVFYESFGGRQFSDSPKAIHEELLRRGVPFDAQDVSVRDGQANVPGTLRPAALNSTEWHEALATYKYIVTNSHLPQWFTRRDGQVVVQTWHGTPLKQIGFDVTDIRHADRNYLSRVAKETPNWTFLVSPNTFSTPILKRAFRYDGELLESGYPRNDLLFRDDPELLADIRRRLGLPAGKRVVLYAPTWRDDEFYGQGRYRMRMHLNLAAARRKLGDDHVLLVRRHPNVVDPIPDDGSGFALDVSTYPDTAELLAITDVLITDYSSVMFDFANTGRPILFFTYDLEHYRDTLRGFYFDFENEAPGPLLSTSDEVIGMLADIRYDPGAFADQRKEFQRRFCDLDDGHATGRVVDHMLELGGR